MLTGTAGAAEVSVFLKITLGVVKQDLLAFTFMQHLAAFVLKLVPIVVLTEHLVKEVSVIIFVFLVHRGGMVLDHFFVIVLEQFVPALGDARVRVDVCLIIQEFL